MPVVIGCVKMKSMIYLDKIWRGEYNSCFKIDKRFIYDVLLLHNSDEKIKRHQNRPCCLIKRDI